MRARLPVCIVIAALVVGLAGCKQAQELVDKVTSKVGEVAKQAASATDSSRQTLGGYADGYNKVLDEVMDAVEDYERAIPFDKTPGPELGKPLLMIPPLADKSMQEIKAAFASAASSAPAEMKYLAPMADELAAASDEVLKTLTEARKYYDAEDFKDDAYARWKQIHEKMIAAAQRLDKATTQLGAALSGEEDKIAEQELKDYEKDKSYSYYMRFMLHRAKKLEKLVEDPQTDKAAFGKGFDEFGASFDEFAKFCQAKTDMQPAFKSYADMVERFQAAAKRLRRELEAEKPDPQKLSQEANAVVDAYNSMVSLRNSLASLEQMGQLK